MLLLLVLRFVCGSERARQLRMKKQKDCGWDGSELPPDALLIRTRPYFLCTRPSQISCESDRRPLTTSHHSSWVSSRQHRRRGPASTFALFPRSFLNTTEHHLHVSSKTLDDVIRTHNVSLRDWPAEIG
ncbi:hypothetical protein BLNAU_20142 [Blattamonas nauphoetae]|uniref:Secreted protein n=1 Tax=Blattamonas nauphoetae TaxID=2049346 RepID=A0ABQ9X2W2_9EUKA|nr:hypothetical protein BLNAU_20142 [Blattamonas nauphoetae]